MKRHEMQVVSRASGSVRVPGSKSLTLRSIVCGALASGESVLENALISSDSVGLAAAFRAAGLSVEVDEAARRFVCRGDGRAPRAESPTPLDVADCGTCMRFAVALCAAGEGEWTLDGTSRMRERPIGGLVRALEPHAGAMEYIGGPGCPPLRVRATGLDGGRFDVDASESSQYVSALLLAAPLARGPVEVRPLGSFPSRPYVDLTLQTMAAFGIDVASDGECFRISPGTYVGRPHSIEGDWSSASYFLAAAAITGGEVEVEGVRGDSRQGDRRFVDFLEALGCRHEPTEKGVRLIGASRPGDVTFDFGDCPDVVPTAAIAAAFHPGRVSITGAPHLRLKESDRIAVVCDQLRRLGASAEERDDGMVIEGGHPLTGAEIDTHDDHRIAMSFAIAGLRVPGVVLLDPDCTSKSYPGFFEDLDRLAGA